MSAKITLTFGKKKLTVTAKEAKELHKQLDEMFEGKKARTAAHSMEETMRKLREQCGKFPSPPTPIPYNPWLEIPRERKPSPQWPHERPLICHHNPRTHFGDPVLQNDRRPH